MIGWIAIAMTACILLYVATLVDDWGRDFNQNYAKLDRANQDVGLQPVIIPASPGEVRDYIQSWAEAKRQWAVVQVDEQDNVIEIHLTRTTRIMRFVDDIQATITGIEVGSRVEAESQSRLGVGDLGQNPRNLKELVASLRELR